MYTGLVSLLISLLGAAGADRAVDNSSGALLHLGDVAAHRPVGDGSDRSGLAARGAAGQSRFARGNSTFQIYGSNNFADEGKGEMWSGHFGLGHYIEDGVSINLDLFGAWVRSGIDDNGVAGGLDLYGRWHCLVDEADKWSFFLDAGAGVQQASTNYAGSRHFNFRLFPGFGGTLRLSEKLDLLGGARYLHISDAGFAGGGGGGFDGIFIYFGLTKQL